MGATLAVILLIVIGVILLLLEFLVIPGTTIAAIGGILFIAAGIYMSYESFGTTTGNYVLLGSVAFLFISIIWALRWGTWRKFMLKENVEGAVLDEDSPAEVQKGDEGISISRLNPMGRVKVNKKTYEARSYDTFVNERTPVKVVKVESNKLIVKQINYPK